MKRSKRSTGDKYRPAGRLSKRRLEALVDEATVDAYGDSEQATGFLTMMDDNLRLPSQPRFSEWR